MASANKGKAIKYNAFGLGLIPAEFQLFGKVNLVGLVPSEHLMAGGNHVSYRKTGFGISWRVGVQNIQINRAGFGDLNIDTARANSWLTGKSKTTYSFGANANFVFAITKKIPAYIGVGTIRKRQFYEIQTPFANPGNTEWQIDRNETKFVLNFGGGVFIPLASRVVLNLGYDYLPQMLFVGIAISGPFNYEDIDLW